MERIERRRRSDGVDAGDIDVIGAPRKVADPVMLAAGCRAIAVCKHKGVGAIAAGEGVDPEAADQDVVSPATRQRIVAPAAIERVGDGLAGQAVVSGAADAVVDVGPRIVVEQIGVEDVALRVVPGSEIGELRGRSDRRRSDGYAGGVVSIGRKYRCRYRPRPCRRCGWKSRRPGRGLRHAVDENICPVVALQEYTVFSLWVLKLAP